jgi:hypothetical protein
MSESGNQSRLERHKSFLNLILENICTGEEAPKVILISKVPFFFKKINNDSKFFHVMLTSQNYSGNGFELHQY